MTDYRLFPSVNGPPSPVSFGSSIIVGIGFCVTAEAWFQGYWFWCCDSGQPIDPVKCALWQIDPNNTSPELISNSVVTSAELIPGQWNWIPLSVPLPLSAGGSAGASPKTAVTGIPGSAQYIAAVGMTGNFPDTNHYWGSGNTAAAGIVNGPLTAYSAPSGSLPAPYGGMAQGVYSTSGSDPSVICPESPTGSDDNIWLDVQVSDYSAAPLSAPLRLWPNFPLPTSGIPNNDNTLSVSGTAFTLSQNCTLEKIWFYSPSGSEGFPSHIGIWNSDSKTEVSGTGNASPSWLKNGSAATAGSGWIYADYSGAGIVLPSGNYVVAFYNGNGLKIYSDNPNYFFTGVNPVGGASVGGPGWNGLSWGNGILTAPNVGNGPLLTYDDSSGIKPGQTTYKPNSGAWVYPDEFEASADWGETRWIDIEITPLLFSTGSISLKKMSLSGIGQEKIPGSGEVVLPKMSLSGAGNVESFGSGSGSIVLKKMFLSGTGREKASGSGSIAMKKMRLRGHQPSAVQASELFVFSPL